MRILKESGDRIAIGKELMGFLWSRKLWWLTPMVAVLLVFAVLIFFASATGVGPFVYTLF